MSFKEWLNEEKIIDKLKYKGDDYKLTLEYRWGGMATYIIFKNGYEQDQLAPNIKEVLAKKEFKKLVKSGKFK